MLLSPHCTRTAVYWVIGFFLAYALQLILIWAVADPTIQSTLQSATEFPFILLFCLTVTTIYSREAPGKKKTHEKKVVLETAVNNENIGALETAVNDENIASAATGNNEGDEKDNKKNGRPLLVYLTHLKVFLTFTVVTHHMVVAFSGFPVGPLVIGAYPNWFQFAALIFLNLNQAYFMPLFYFISAYFCEGSYDRKGRARFMHGKAQRYLLPSLFVIFTLNPYSMMIANAVAGLTIWYFPLVFHCWFLLWLIVFHWMFVTFREASDKGKQEQDVSAVPAQEQAIQMSSPHQQEGLDVEQGKEEPTTIEEASPIVDPEANYTDIPNALYRWAAGVILGVVNGAFALSMQYNLFYTLPTPPAGSFPSDFFLFVLGLIAARRGWLRPSALSISTVRWSYLGMTVVVAAYITVEYMRYAGRITMKENANAFYSGILSGIFCLDFSLVCLHFFHTFCNKTSRLGKMMGQAAYTVYLIHYIFTVVAMAVFIKVYNSIYDEQVIYFVGSTISFSVLRGPADGAIQLFGGFVVCTILVQAIVWPLAYGIKQIPGVKQVL